jgi:adenosylmethionine-8-amino-7-oxononanoate transaminase
MTSLADKDHRYLWHPFTQMKEWMGEEPVIIQSGDRAILWDVHGNEYIDANSSIWTNLHGHRHPKITQAIKDQLNHIAHSSFLGLSNVPAIELAEKLIAIAPHADGRMLSRVFYSDDGSTAMEVALKMALQYWQHKKQPKRTQFVAFADAYHGDTLGAVSIGGIDLFHAAFKPLLFDVIRVNELSRLHDVMNDTVAAVVIEPMIQGAAGMKLWPRGLLRDLRQMCDETGALLIADEVMTGFGRTGKMFACEHEGVVPDLMAVAKGLSGGYLPLAATLTTEEVFNAFLGDYGEFKTFFHGHSYTGNQLGCAAALANLQVFEEERVMEKLSAISAQLSAGMERLKTLPHVADVWQIGLIAAVEFGPYTLTDRVGHKVCLEMRKRGVLTRPLGNVVPIMPPYCMTEAQLERALTVLADSIREVVG